MSFHTSPVSVLPRWRRISSSMSTLSASPSTSPMQLRSCARLDQVLPCSSLNTCGAGTMLSGRTPWQESRKGIAAPRDCQA